MKLNRKRIITGIVTCLLLSLFLTACSKNGLKTVIIDEPDTTETGDNSNSTEQFENSKTYKYSAFSIIDNVPVNEVLLGWFDNENMASVLYKQKKDRVETTIESVNYKYHFSKSILAITPETVNFSLSPDGKYLGYVTEDKKLYLKDIKSGKDKLIAEIPKDEEISNITINWSNTGSYLTFSAFNYDARDVEAYLWNISKGILYNIHLDMISMARADDYNVVISDDGLKLILNMRGAAGGNEYDYFINLYTLNKETYQPEKAVSMNDYQADNAVFVNSNEVMFIDRTRYALCYYDISKAKVKEVSQDISFFKVSNDNKNIVYEKFEDESSKGIYTAKIKSGKLEDEKLIYQGFLPDYICWSQDNKKVLFSGRYTYVNQDIPDSSILKDYTTLENLVIELY